MPQIENGYTKIANELLEALARFSFSGSEFKCVLFIIRKTYGFNKKADWVSNSQFVQGTGLEKSNVCRAIRGLVSKKVVVKFDNKRTPTYRLNKNYWQWGLLSKTTTRRQLSNLTTTVVKNDNKVFVENVAFGEGVKYCKNVNISIFKSPKIWDYCGNLLLSNLTNTKKSNTVTKKKDAAESGQEKKKEKTTDKNILQKMKTLSLIANGRTDHHLVSEYAWSGESFEDMQVRAKKELEDLKREIKG